MGDENNAEREGKSSPQQPRSTQQLVAALIPSVPAQKQDPTKTGFYDLPAELRLEIYERHCNLLAFEQDSGGNLYVPTGCTNDRWTAYFKSILEAQLLCHQFREEFMPVWAAASNFELYNIHCGPFQDPLLIRPEVKDMWLHVRTFLDRIGPVARHHVRFLKLKYNLETYGYQSTAEPLRQATGEKVQRLFERLSDVYRNLTIEVELVCAARPVTNVYKRIYTLRQLPVDVVRGTGRNDWLLQSGPVLIRKFDHRDCPCAMRCRTHPTYLTSSCKTIIVWEAEDMLTQI